MAIQLSGSLAITGSLVATSQIVAQTLNVQQVTSSIVYSSGSNIFGNSVSNTQQFTGSLQVSSSTSYILGNVGIGTTGPGYKLQVNGSSSGTVAVFAYNGAFAGTCESNIGLRFYCGDNDSDIPQIKLRGYGTSNYTGNFAIDVMCGGTYPNTYAERFTIQGTTGNVGIGTTNPTDKLVVEGSDVNVTAKSTSNVSALKLINTSGTSSMAQVSNALVFEHLGSERMKINSDGDLELKGRSTTTNFQTVFYSANDQFAINATNTSTGKTINFNPANTFTALSIASTGISTFSCQVCSPSFIGGTVSGTTVCASNGVIGNNSNNLYLSSNSAAGEISFWGNQLNTRLMTLNGCGNLGIGTSTPLFIAGFTTLQVTGTTNGLVYVTGACSTGGHLYAGNGLVNVGASSSHPLAINTNDTPRITISSTGIACFSCQMCAPAAIFTGCVGIGVTSPVSSLHIIRALGSDVINIGESGTGTRFAIGQEASYTGNYINSRNIDLKLQAFCAGGSGGNIHFQTGTDGTGCVTTKMFLCSTGLVGIGTISPTGQLHICGSDPAFRIQSTVSGNMQMGQWDGTNNRIQSSGRDFLLTQTDANNMLFHTNSTERMRITNAGAVAIRATCIGLSDIADRTLLLGSRPGNADIVSFGFDPGGTWKAGFDYKGSDGQLEWWTNNGSWCRRIMYTPTGVACFSNTVCAPVAVFSGCVGIGTTTPKGRLHLTGIYDGAQNTLNLENNWPNTHYTSLINFWAYYNSTDPMAVIEAGQDSSATNAGVIMFKTMDAGAAPVTRMCITPRGAACFACQVCVAEKITVKNGNNSIFPWSDALDGQPGMFAVSCIGSSLSGLYAKVYGPSVNAGIFGTNTQCVAFIGTEGACNKGLIIGTINSAPIYIGTSNSNRLIIEASGIATFSCQVSVGPTLTIGNQGGTDTTIVGGGSGVGSLIRMNYAGGTMQNLFQGNGDNYVNCFTGKLNAAGGVKFAGGGSTLNYYEQGTWTPRLTNGSFTSNAGTENAGWYIRVGNIVTVGGTLNWSGGSGAQDGNSLRITCLPFAANNTNNYRSVGQFGAPATDSIGFKNACAQMTLVVDPGASFIYIIENYQNGTYLTYTHSPCANTSGTIYGFQATYQI